MTRLRQILRRLRDRSGATVIEYTFIVALVAMAMIGGAFNLGESVQDMYNTISGRVDDSVKAGSTGGT